MGGVLSWRSAWLGLVAAVVLATMGVIWGSALPAQGQETCADGFTYCRSGTYESQCRPNTVNCPTGSVSATVSGCSTCACPGSQIVCGGACQTQRTCSDPNRATTDRCTGACGSCANGYVLNASGTCVLQQPVILGPTSGPQAASTASFNPVVDINQTGSGDLLRLQKGGKDIAEINATGVQLGLGADLGLLLGSATDNLLYGAVKEASNAAAKLLKIETVSASGATTQRLSLDLRGNLVTTGAIQSLDGNVVANGDVIGSRLCIDADCKDVWPSGGVSIQSSTPGTAQTGNFNVSGTGAVGSLTVSGTGTVNLQGGDIVNADIISGGADASTRPFIDLSGESVAVAPSNPQWGLVVKNGFGTQPYAHLWHDGTKVVLNDENSSATQGIQLDGGNLTVSENLDIGRYALQGDTITNVGRASGGISNPWWYLNARGSVQLRLDDDSNADSEFRINNGANQMVFRVTENGDVVMRGSSNDTLKIIGTNNAGYSQLWLQGTGRIYQLGVGNAGETVYGVADKAYLFDQQANRMRLVVDTAGNVGIGTTSPARLLDVNGPYRFVGDVEGRVNMESGSWSWAHTSGDSADKWVQIADLTLAGAYGQAGVVWETSPNQSNHGDSTETLSVLFRHDGSSNIEGSYDIERMILGGDQYSIKDVKVVEGAPYYLSGVKQHRLSVWAQANASWLSSVSWRAYSFGTVTLNRGSLTQYATIQDGGTTYHTTGVYTMRKGRMGIGTTSPNEALEVAGAVRGNVNGALRISTGNGYVDVGPQNPDWSHFATDRAKFYFDKPVYANGAFSSYSTNDLLLQTNGTTRIFVRNSDGKVGIGTTDPGTAKLYVKDGDDGATADIAQFFANNLTQGIGIGYNRIEAVGSIADQNIVVIPKGTGNVIVGPDANISNARLVVAENGDVLARGEGRDGTRADSIQVNNGYDCVNVGNGEIRCNLRDLWRHADRLAGYVHSWRGTDTCTNVCNKAGLAACTRLESTTYCNGAFGTWRNEGAYCNTSQTYLNPGTTTYPPPSYLARFFPCSTDPGGSTRYRCKCG